MILSRTKKILIGVAITLCVAVSVGGYLYVHDAEVLSAPPFAITFLNVGQGDSIVIQSSEGFTILIDGGPDNTVLGELKETLPRSDKTIELVILTHPDSDHAGGLLSVLQYYQVTKILTSGLKGTAQLSRSLARLIREKNIPLVAADAQSDFVVQSAGITARFDILYPLERVVYSHDAANNDSVTFALHIAEHSFLFTGDIEASTEEKMLKAYHRGELDVDILKLAHHGSKTSSIPAFLAAASPALAIASVGKNNTYNHPSPSVTEQLKSLRIPLLRTDLHGRISFHIAENGHLTYTCEQVCTRPR